MPKPAHRVQLQKQESLAGGGDPADDNELLWDCLDASEDAPDLAGVYFQEGALRDTVVTIYRESDRLYFEDADYSGITRQCLADLASGALPPATEVGQVLQSLDGSNFQIVQPIISCDGWLSNDCEMLVEGLGV